MKCPVFLADQVWCQIWSLNTAIQGKRPVSSCKFLFRSSLNCTHPSTYTAILLKQVNDLDLCCSILLKICVAARVSDRKLVFVPTAFWVVFPRLKGTITILSWCLGWVFTGKGDREAPKEVESLASGAL